jgi:hypothetical protein
MISLISLASCSGRLTGNSQRFTSLAPDKILTKLDVKNSGDKDAF